MIMLGVADWPRSRRPPRAARQRQPPVPGRTPVAAVAPEAQPAPAANDKPDVDVWHWNDTTVMSAQKISVAADRRRNLPAVWHLSAEQAGRRRQVLQRERVADSRHDEGARERVHAVSDGPVDRPRRRRLVSGGSDHRRADAAEERRHRSACAQHRRQVRRSMPKAGHYWTIDLATKAVTNITARAEDVVRRHSSPTARRPDRPMFGIGGWTKDDRGGGAVRQVRRVEGVTGWRDRRRN